MEKDTIMIINIYKKYWNHKNILSNIMYLIINIIQNNNNSVKFLVIH